MRRAFVWHARGSSTATNMPIHSIEPRRLYRQIADQIRTLIRSGEFTAGQRLPPERDLARQLGVSRPSVREALIALEVEGLVDVRIGSGIYVLRSGHQRRRGRRYKRRPARSSLLRARWMIEGECAASGGEVGEKRRRSPRWKPRWPDAARSWIRTKSSRSRPIACFTCASPKATGNGALVGRAENAVGRAHRTAVQATRASLRHARAVGRRHCRASRSAECHRGQERRRCARRDAAPPEQAYKRFSTGWDKL